MITKHKKALILGVSGQDGAYLAKFLVKKNYEIYGTTRDLNKYNLKKLAILGVAAKINVHLLEPTDGKKLTNLIKVLKPDEIYNLSGQTSVGQSFLMPQKTFLSITLVTLNILEAIKSLNLNCKFYNASSSECFGDTGDLPSNEKTKFNPCSPYGVSKCSSFWLTKNYRDSYNLFSCSGILYNHESPLRPEKFVTKKIIKTAVSIYFGKNVKLNIGDLSIQRDWGWAPDYVEAMWLILQNSEPQDFVISTGKLSSLEFFVENVFSYLNLSWKEYTTIDKTLFRSSELKSSFGDPQKAKSILGWEAKTNLKDVIKKMVDFEIKNYQS